LPLVPTHADAHTRHQDAIGWAHKRSDTVDSIEVEVIRTGLAAPVDEEGPRTADTGSTARVEDSIRVVVAEHYTVHAGSAGPETSTPAVVLHALVAVPGCPNRTSVADSGDIEEALVALADSIDVT
jgi:hypothetical protein